MARYAIRRNAKGEVQEGRFIEPGWSLQPGEEEGFGDKLPAVAPLPPPPASVTIDDIVAVLPAALQAAIQARIAARKSA